MELLEAINGRRSIRSYQDKQVPKKLIQKIIDAAIMAPSVLNAQPWLFTVLTKEKRDEAVSVINKSLLHLQDMFSILTDEEREKFEKEHAKRRSYWLNYYENIGGAPVLIIVSMSFVEGQIQEKMALIGCSAAMQNMMLVAHDEGLGTVCVGSSLWVEKEIMRAIGLRGHRLIGIIAVGYPAESPPTPPRKKDVVDWNGY